MRKQAFFSAHLLVGASLIFPPQAYAQTSGGNLPTREQIELPKADALRPLGKATMRSGIEIAPCPFRDSALQVDLRQVRFAGPDGAPLPAPVSQILDAMHVQPGLQPVANLCAVRDQANGALYHAGYIASVQIPPQEITAGTAQLNVILAKLVRVDVQGNPGRHAATLQARIAQLQSMEFLNRFEAERILLIAGDVPGLDVALSLRSAGTTSGEVIGDLTVRYSPFTIVGNVQNYGSRQIGRTIGTVRAEFNGLTGQSDRTFVGASISEDGEEQRVLQAGHQLADTAGRTLGVRVSHAWSRPDLGPLDIRSESLIAGLDFSVPLFRSLRSGVVAGGGFELVDQSTFLGGGDDRVLLTRDKLRVLFANLSGSTRAVDANGSPIVTIGGSLELRRGLDILGATKRGEIDSDGVTQSRLNGDPTATVVRAGLEGVAYVGAFSLQALIQAQWADNPLLSLEQFNVGNLTLGRGYDPGAVGGDRALGLRLEPRLQLPTHNIAFQLFAFHDRVRIKNLDVPSGSDDRILSSSGGGARIGLPGSLLLEAIYARPHDRVSDQPGAMRPIDRVLLSLTAQFPRSGR